jgi:hypothetical protein
MYFKRGKEWLTIGEGHYLGARYSSKGESAGMQNHRSWFQVLSPVKIFYPIFQIVVSFSMYFVDK